MLKRIGAMLLALGLCLPYGCDTRPITGVWHDAPSILFLGVPVLATIAYVLHAFVPALAQFHARHGQGLHGLFRVVFFVLAGAYLANALTKDRGGWPGPIDVVVALAVTGGLLYWEQGRATKAERLPLLLLVGVGVPVVAYLVGFLREGELQYGGWVLTAGYVVAVAAEIQGLRAAPKVTHGG